MSHSQHPNEKDTTTRNFLIGIAIVLLLFGVAMYKNIKNPHERTNVENVHWHSPITYEICGEKVVMNEKQAHGLLHGHNDGIIHVEGALLVEKSIPVKGFFDAIGLPFSSTQIGEYKNGDTCPNGTEPGEVLFFVNGEQNFKYETYILRENDVFLIKFE